MAKVSWESADTFTGSLLITGGTGVIGEAVLRRLAEDPEWAGTRLVLPYRSDEKFGELERKLPFLLSRLVGVRVDIQDAQAKAILRQSLQQYQPWRGAVLAAGISQDKSLARVEEEDWQQIWRLNAGINSKLLQNFQGFGLMPGTSFVLVSSVVGYRGNAGQGAYAASKGALIDWMRFYGDAFAQAGARLNVLFPPLVESPLLAGLSEQARQKLFSQRLLPDAHPAQTCAEQIVFLLSRRSSYVHGQIWHGDSRVSSLPW